MKQIILYDSATGNTEYLAKALSHALPNVPCGPVGSLDCSKAELVYLGFWTDKGTCSDRLRAVLPSLGQVQADLSLRHRRLWCGSGVFFSDHPPP